MWVLPILPTEWAEQAIPSGFWDSVYPQTLDRNLQMQAAIYLRFGTYCPPTGLSKCKGI
jgi:hypothetical protein